MFHSTPLPSIQPLYRQRLSLTPQCRHQAIPSRCRCRAGPSLSTALVCRVHRIAMPLEQGPSMAARHDEYREDVEEGGVGRAEDGGGRKEKVWDGREASE